MHLFYSDLHIRPERLDDCEAVLSEIFEIASKIREKVKKDVMIVNGGDTFNTRGVINTKCFDVVAKHWSKWKKAGFTQVVLVGNHDQEDRAGDIHPYASFKDWGGFHVVDAPMTLGHIDFFPYISADKVEVAIKSMKSFKSKDAVVHWGIRGAQRNDTNIDNEGVPLNWLSHYRNVFSGHYHYRSAFENVQYIGSPLQQNFGEMGQEKGVLLYDAEKNKRQFIELKSAPRHFEVVVRWEDDKQVWDRPSGIGEKDFVRVRVYGDSELCASVGKSDVEKSIKCREIKIERVVQDVTSSRLDLSKSDIYNLKSLASKYVGHIETDLNKEKLMSFFEEIGNE